MKSNSSNHPNYCLWCGESFTPKNKNKVRRDYCHRDHKALAAKRARDIGMKYMLAISESNGIPFKDIVFELTFPPGKP